MTASWIVCQLGAREHYAVARMMRAAGCLEALATDAWAPPGSVWRRLPSQWVGRLHERFHPALAGATVRAATTGLIRFETRRRLRRSAGLWPTIMARNAWFGAWLAGVLERQAAQSGPKVLFAYSYAARRAFEVARRHGWTTVLGQIDPGPVEADLVVEEHRRRPELGARWQAPPAAYWESWREECRLADCIVVNSEWSRSALVQAGIAAEKLRVVPLAFEAGASPVAGGRDYPAQFSRERPLRVLFLGLVNLRKGVARLLDAARELRGEPAEFHLVGPVDLAHPPDAAALPNVHWHGPVRRQAVGERYRQADVFLFPTLSDGFGLTQLEAQAQRLPVIATQRCGAVVRDGVNGRLLAEPTPAAIVAVLRELLARPGRLAEMSAASKVESCFSLSSIGEQLVALVEPFTAPADVPS